MRTLTLVAFFALAACSSLPRPADSAPEPATPSASSADARKPADAAAQAFKAPTGYELQLQEGEPVYCRSVVTVGSRFPKKFCLTQAQLKKMEERKMSMQEEHGRRTRMCTTVSACGDSMR